MDRLSRQKEVYAAFDGVDEALRTRYLPVLETEGARLGLDEHDFGVAMAALPWEPLPTEAWLFGLRNPYTSRQVYEGALQASAARGVIEQISTGQYRMTDRGRQACQALLLAARAAMEPAAPYPPAPVERFAALLRVLVEACLGAPMPPERWCITFSRYHYPGDDAPPFGRIDQWLTDLRAFRDDAHLAAWRAEGVSGPALEALTVLWRGQADTLDALCEKLTRRGHPRAVYAAALAELRARGWSTGPDEHPALTSDGRAARACIEARTNELFYRPWSALSDDDLTELLTLTATAREMLEPGQGG